MNLFFTYLFNSVFILFSVFTSFSRPQTTLSLWMQHEKADVVNFRHLLFDVYRQDTMPTIVASDYYVSNRGLNSNSGLSDSTPKLNIDSVETLLVTPASTGRKVTLHLEANSVFREQFDPHSNNLNLNQFNLTDGKHPARISGMNVIDDWRTTPGRANVFQHLLKHDIDLYSPDYSYIMVAEIDTQLEKTHPVSAVKYLRLVSGVGRCDSTAGSYYTAGVITNPASIYIHPTQGSPGRNKYRYEVTTRNFGINGLYVNHSTYEKLFLQSSAYGYGMLSAGKNTLVRNVIFQGGGTHHLVMKSGSIDSSVFLPGPQGLKDRIAAIFYEAEGTNNVNTLTNSVFLDIPNAVYTHTNGVVKHQSFTIDKVFAFADTLDAGTAFGGNDTDSISVLNSYTENYPTGWTGVAPVLNIKNSIFRNTNQSAIAVGNIQNVAQNTTLHNVLIKTNGNDKNQNEANHRSAFGVRAPYPTSNVEVSNTILHGYSTWKSSGTVIYSFQVGGQFKAHHNIYICDVNDNNFLHIFKATNNGETGKSDNIVSDSNVYILARGAGFHWFVDPFNAQENNIFTLSEFTTLTGQDKHSLFIDIRNNPLGLKAIFIDPDNGNWTLTQTPYANAIRELRAGMTTPPLYYPQRPSVEHAVSYTSPEGFSSFNGTINANDESVLEWRTFNESEISSFLIEYSKDDITYTSAGNVQANSAGKDNTYQFVHTPPETSIHHYRLKLINKDGNFRYSPVVVLKPLLNETNKIVFYPNPVKNAVTVKHPKRNTATFHIYDLSGKLVRYVRANSGSQTILYLNNLPGGMYVVRWKSNNEQLSRTIFKQN